MEKVLARSLIDFDANARLNFVMVSLAGFVGHLKLIFSAVIGTNRKANALSADDRRIQLWMNRSSFHGRRLESPNDRKQPAGLPEAFAGPHG